jgi:prepilin-type processing-associated H-X9-DG protein
MFVFIVAASRSSYFSIEINHGGYFLGTGANMSYVDGHVIWYDNVDSATWSPSVLENGSKFITVSQCSRLAGMV